MNEREQHREQHRSDVRTWGYNHRYLGAYMRRDAATFAKEDGTRARATAGLAIFTGSGELTPPITPTAQEAEMPFRDSTVEAMTAELLRNPAALFAVNAPSPFYQEKVDPALMRQYLAMTATGRAVLAARDKAAYQAGKTPVGAPLSAEDRQALLSQTALGRSHLRDEQKTRGAAKS